MEGTLTVTPQETSGSSPAGFSFFDREVVLEGPAAAPTAPYTVTFTVDSTALNGIAPADVQVFRNGAAVAGCTHETAAVPDPCVVSRGVGGGGDALVTVRTSRFSVWSLGRLQYGLAGPLPPVASLPAVNRAKAGSAVPVKFQLGGDRGLDVLAAGYPASGPCLGASQPVGTTKPPLSYDAATGQYTFIWRTPADAAGCHELVLRFRDGSQLVARFDLVVR